jgi:GNAT superfamily N-acetyltransferase
MSIVSPDLALTFTRVEEEDAAAVAELRAEAARDLTVRFGHGRWSGEPSERGVRNDLKRGRIWLARHQGEPAGTFILATRKPWAIDASYFTLVARPIYLRDMAVHPRWQRRGVGRRCLEHAVEAVREWPGDAIRLDAYDADAGAGGFYARCGFRETGRTAYRGNPLIYYELVL